MERMCFIFCESYTAVSDLVLKSTRHAKWADTIAHYSNVGTVKLINIISS